jgi:phosphatidylglycerol:prolipoprotein diacylglycerol transferase
MYPVLFQISSFTLYSYPVILFVSLLFFSFLFLKQVRKKKLSLSFVNDYFFVYVISLFLGARLFAFIKNPEVYFTQYEKMFHFLDSGYDFFGGFLFFSLTLFFLCRLKKEDFGKWFEVFSSSFFLFAFGMALADFFAGKNYGLPSTLPFALTFESPEIRYTLPIHPVQLYEALLVLCIPLFLSLKKFSRPLEKASARFFFYFLSLAFLSFLRGSPEVMWFSFSSSFLFSLSFAFVFLIILVSKKYP